MSPADLADRIRDRFPDTVVARGETTAIAQRDELIDGLAWLRDEPDLSLGFLSSVAATDWPGRDPRFWVVYELRSMQHKHRARVKVTHRDVDKA